VAINFFFRIFVLYVDLIYKMKEIRNIINTYDQIDWTKEQAALATVVSVEESAYRRIGARMLVQSSGIWIGGISGGCLEGDALKRANVAIFKKEPSIVVYDTMDDDDHQIGVGLGCNGRIEVLFTPINPNDKNNPIERLKTIQEKRTPSIFYQVIGLQEKDIRKMGLFANEDNAAIFVNTLGISKEKLSEKTALVHQRRKSKVFDFKTSTGQSISILIEFLRPELKLIIVGDNYDVNAFAGIANELGWEINIVGLKRKLNKSIFSLSKQILPYEQASDLVIDEYTAVVLMSHDYKWDLETLLIFLKQNPPYMGMLGPKKRMLKMQTELQNHSDAINLEKLNFFFSPIGLDIGAESPEEIALSIAGEIIAHFRNRTGSFLRLRKGTIHERTRMN